MPVLDPADSRLEEGLRLRLCPATQLRLRLLASDIVSEGRLHVWRPSRLVTPRLVRARRTRPIAQVRGCSKLIHETAYRAVTWDGEQR